ncbi:glycoside hydrolase family 2 TIM barrel-domain containing protein [Pontiella agarivorans]|uniref:Glycoside hydrolase family 2 TIM barrel-domain containing protein n=1 Tax=Pontiella agarivorans TaxID=3038953 RepID=A0ABU5MX77_9BACT|nr:glycoside hydrolase family 2 TIM barrel-domain containing protein [Pontiella agarivorans]MDZ8118785.1 glycoside hydrolase family 2 TIM barrel-domain containing protein [Pontiella agarivorans]
MMNRIVLLFLCLPLLTCAQRVSLNLGTGWMFGKDAQDNAAIPSDDDLVWEEVTVPHTWNTDLIQNQINSEHYQGVGWYRRSLPVQPDMRGKRLFLRFEGALASADVFLNDKKVGRHEGGYTAFCFEVTDLINWNGENTLMVKVNNADNPNIVPDGSRLFTRFGGIYRPVALLVTDPTCITPLDYASPGVFIRQDSVSEKCAELTVTAKLSNALKTDAAMEVSVQVIDAVGKVVARAVDHVRVGAGETVPMVRNLTIESPILWGGRENPYLYTVDVEVRRGGIAVDKVTQPLGLRFFHVDASTGFFLNGKPYRMYGVSRHQDWEHEGSALTFKHHQHDVAEMMEIGATTVRLAHYPQAADMYNLCDTNGLIVWAEIPVVQGVNVKRYAGAFENAKQQLVEMIRQNYNNPSIFFWGLYNECWIDADKVQILHDLAKAEDPGRLTTAGSNQKLSEKHHITDVVCWNKYPRWYGGFDLEKWADDLHKTHPDLKVGISEYGAGGCIDQHQIPPKKPNPTKGRFFPEEYMNQIHEEVWPMLEEREFFWGTYLWNLFDFSWPGVTRGSRINLNNKGLITYDRQTRKDPFYYYKANWSDEPVLYITSRRFIERSNPQTPVKVYSNCGKIELTLNGKTYPAPKSSYGVTVWPNLTLVEGENRVEVKGIKDGQIVKDACVWILNTSASAVPGEKTQTVEERSVDVSAFTVSSEQKHKGHVAKNAFDNHSDTFWCAAQERVPQWIVMDLLQETDIGGISILWGRKGRYEYTVQVSQDGQNWKTVVTNSKKGQKKNHQFTALARFVRIHCTQTPPGSPVAIREINVLTR